MASGCDSSGLAADSTNADSPHSRDSVIIQTRQDGDHLDVFTMEQPPVPGARPFTSEEKEIDYLRGRTGETLGRNINGSIYRYPVTWDLSTGQGTVGSRIPLDGGNGLYISDFGFETSRRVSLPDQDGTYLYEYTLSNTKGVSLKSTYTYTRSGSQATLVYRGWGGEVYQVYSGAPLTSSEIGFGSNTGAYFQLSEQLQDSRYTGTWTISENFHGGVTGETGKFDLRRIGVSNLLITPEQFNPLKTDEAEIQFDLVALPVTTELAPDGWQPGNVNWMVSIDDPLKSQAPLVTLTGSLSPSAPDASGKIGRATTTWDGKKDGEFLLNATYPVRTQCLANIGSGGGASRKKLPVALKSELLGVRVKNFSATPENFDPGSGDSTTLSFELEAVGFENPNLSWDLEVTQNDIPIHKFPIGEAQAKTKSVEITWNGETSSGTVSPGELEYQLIATACEGEVQARSANPTLQRVLFQTSEGVCAFKAASTRGNAIGISIENEKLNPEEPFTEPGSEVDLTADIIVTAPGDFELFWTVHLQDPNGNLGPKIAEGEGPLIQATWNGEIDGVRVDEPSSYELLIEAHACPAELQLPKPTSDCLTAEKLMGLGGNRAVISFFDLNGKEIDTLQPSYLFQVVQSLDVLDRNGQEPGSQLGEHIVVPKVKPSICRVDIQFVSVRTREESYSLKVDADEVFNEVGGHLHSNFAPPGILSKERSTLEKDFEVLSSEQLSKIGDGGVAITAPEEITFKIASGERKFTLYYLAPISSNRRRFVVAKEGSTKEVGSKILLIGIKGLEKLADRLTISKIPFKVDPGPPNPEPKPPGGIVLTGGTTLHQDNHNGVTNFNIRLAQLARLWAKYESKRTLYFNDMSLPLGGKFSIDGTYEVRAKHTEHRVGENIDINTNLTRLQKRDLDLEDYVIRASLTVYDEKAENHYHLRFPKGGN